MSGLKGSLETTPLAELMRDLLFDQRTGVLSLALSVRCEVMFDHGAVVYAKSDDPTQRLEQLLVAWGFLTEQAMPAFVQRAGRDVRGALLREGVFPSAQAFDDFMAQILRERALVPFQHASGAWEFEERDVTAFRAVRFPSTTPNVILEGCRRLGSGYAPLSALRDDDSPLHVNDRPAVTLQALEMAPSEGYVLSLVTGKGTFADIARLSPVGPDETLRLVYALLVLDLVRHPRFANERFSVLELGRRRSVETARDRTERDAIHAEYQRIRGVDLFHIIPGASQATGEALRQAVRAYQDQWRVDRFSPRVARDMREELLLISGRAGELQLVAMEAESRQMLGSLPDAEGADEGSRFKRLELMKSHAQEKQGADEMAARRSFLRAGEAMRSKDFHVALQNVREAIRLNERAEYQALHGEILSMNPHWGKKAEEAYIRAIELDAYDPKLPLALGRIYAKAGLKQRARDQFEKAISLSPDFDEAKQALKDLGR